MDSPGDKSSRAPDSCTLASRRGSSSIPRDLAAILVPWIALSRTHSTNTMQALQLILSMSFFALLAQYGAEKGFLMRTSSPHYTKVLKLVFNFLQRVLFGQPLSPSLVDAATN